MRAIRFHDEARRELVHEVRYYTAIGPALGERFDMAVQAAIRRAADAPELGMPYFFATRRVIPAKFKFSVVYLTEEREILVLAIAPFSRRPGYWRARRK